LRHFFAKQKSGRNRLRTELRIRTAEGKLLGTRNGFCSLHLDDASLLKERGVGQMLATDAISRASNFHLGRYTEHKSTHHSHASTLLIYNSTSKLLTHQTLQKMFINPPLIFPPFFENPAELLSPPIKIQIKPLYKAKSSVFFKGFFLRT